VKDEFRAFKEVKVPDCNDSVRFIERTAIFVVRSNTKFRIFG